MTKRSQTLRRRLRALHFARDTRGIAAVEFALIAPMMIVLYLGLVEVSLALKVDRQVSHSASVVADLVTQVSSVSEDEMEDIFAAALQVAQADKRGLFGMRVASYELDEDGDAVLIGEAYYNYRRRKWLDTPKPEDFSDDLMTADSGVVVASVAYKYKPLGFRKQTMTDSDAGSFLDPTVMMTESFLLKPRRSGSVPLGENGLFMLKCSKKNVKCESSVNPDVVLDSEPTASQ